MAERSGSGLITGPATRASSNRGSSIPNFGASDSELTPPHPPASVSDSASSTIAASGPCTTSVPLSTTTTTTTMSSPFAWHADSAHQTHALVSPVLLAGKSKVGGLLSGLKKMFHHSSLKGPDGRAANGAGAQLQPQQQASRCKRGGSDAADVSSDGSPRLLDPSVSGHGSSSSKMERSVKAPSALRVQVGSNRDLTLAALLTSPVRMPAAPGGGGSGGGGAAALGSPTILHSPMPSMRLDHAPSSHNLNMPLADGDVMYGSGGGSGGEQRLFPNTRGAGGTRPLGPAGGGTMSSGQLLYGNPAALSPCLSSNQLVVSKAWAVGGGGGGGAAAAAAPPHHPLHKSCSSAMSPSGASSCSLAPCLTRGDSLLREDPYGHHYVQRAGGGSGSGGGSGGSRVALPQLPSPRTPQDSSGHSVSSRIPSICSGGGGGGGGSGSGRSGGATPMSMSSPMPAPPAEAVTSMGGGEGDEGACEGEDDVAGSLVLGMNPALPAAMRRRRWSLDDYQVAKRMYKGGTSAVYRATCLRSGMMVALKVYFLSKVPINVVHMIRREIELHVPLVHRNIVTLYAAFQDEKHIVLVEEFAARGDLFGIHRHMNCRLTETQTSELILTPFLDALSYLHARGIMHRDIKPENILFTNDWTLKIADFGVSINVHEERAVTRTGTADYMAPEVERCPLKHAPEDNKDNAKLAYTPAIDIWSVGVLAYEMLVGFPPFVSNGRGEDGGGGGGGGGGALAAFMAEQATRKALRFPASVSAAAKDFILATLNENPGDRPTAQQLLKHPWLFKAARRISTISASRLSNTNLSAVQY